MKAPSARPQTPGEVDEEAAARKPDVAIGDDVFFNHPAGPMSGRVLAAGEHGATLDANGVVHKIKWPHIVGHKRRAPQHYQIAESGEDGHIVTDARGKRLFLLIPNEAHENPLMAKAAKGGVPFAGRPGLAKKTITDKTGKTTTVWTKTSKDQPKGRKKAAPDEPAAAKPGAAAPEGKAKPGESVQFQAGDFKGQGRVTSAGPKGANVQDGSGRTHKVDWDEINTTPDYAPRNEGEDDKSYAKRVVDKMPQPNHLPEDHDKYFKNTENATNVPIDKLHSTKSDEENQQGGDNSPKRMQAALHGKLGKRDPITVTPHPDKPGHYHVQDGNGTYTGAKAAGWKTMPVNIKTVAEHEADLKAKELAKAVIDPKDPKYVGLPPKAEQPSNDKWELINLSKEGLDQLKDWLNRGKGIASKAGCKTMTKGPNEVTSEEWQEPGGMLFIAKLKTEGRKGMYRAEQKVAGYGGNWNRLTDIVRCTIAVDSLDDMHKIMKSLDASGMKVAQTPKNRFLKPTDEGYMDVNLVVTLDNGTHAEVQLNVKDMMRAKNDGHHYYEITRVIDEKYEKRKASPKVAKDGWHPDDQDAHDAAKTDEEKQAIEQKYDAKPAQTKTPRDKWEPADREKHAAAYNKQKEIYGKAYSDHIKKYYGGDESKMIKSARMVLLFFR
jgi:hypothetical protein